MSTLGIFVFAIVVFGLMVTGIILTMLEFQQLTDEPSQRKGAGDSRRANAAAEQRAAASEFRAAANVSEMKAQRSNRTH